MRDKNSPLEGVIESFLLARDDLSETTAKNYQHSLDGFSEWLRATLEREPLVGDVNPETVAQYKKHRDKDSVHVARAAVVALKSLAKYMLERKIWHDNGEPILRFIKTPQTEETRRALTEEEVRKVVAASENSRNPIRDKCLVMLVLGTGLRVKEATGLRLGDVDLVEGIITVRASTTKGRGGYRKPREVTLWPEVVKELDKYMKDARRGSDAPEAALFTDSTGIPLTKSGVGQVFKRIKYRTGITAFCAHVGRHTWATLYRRKGSGDLFDLQEEGGWSDLRMVRRYSKGRPMEERKKAPSPLGGLFGTKAERRSVVQEVVRVSDAA